MSSSPQFVSLESGPDPTHHDTQGDHHAGAHGDGATLSVGHAVGGGNAGAARFSPRARVALMVSLAAAVLVTIIVIAVAPGSGRSVAALEAEKATLESGIGLYAFVKMDATLPFAAGSPMRSAVAKIVQASQMAGDIFLGQVWASNLELRGSLEDTVVAMAPKGTKGKRANSLEEEVAALRLRYFDVNAGPWDQLRGNVRFVNESGKLKVPETEPLAGSYYPDGLTAEQFRAWVDTLPAAEAAAARGFYSVIRRDPTTGKLVVVPYSTAYAERLQPIRKLLESAAEDALKANREESLAAYLRDRAAAFSSDDYYDSDLAWLAVNSTMEVVIGAYETYLDGLNGFKAAFEAEVAVVRTADTIKWRELLQFLPRIEAALPEVCGF
jgi:hypothetical protein